MNGISGRSHRDDSWMFYSMNHKAFIGGKSLGNVGGTNAVQLWHSAASGDRVFCNRIRCWYEIATANSIMLRRSDVELASIACDHVKLTENSFQRAQMKWEQGFVGAATDMAEMSALDNPTKFIDLDFNKHPIEVVEGSGLIVANQEDAKKLCVMFEWIEWQ